MRVCGNQSPFPRETRLDYSYHRDERFWQAGFE